MAFLTIGTVLLALFGAWAVNRLLNFTRILSSLGSQPRTYVWAPPFELINALLPACVRFDAPDIWATKFERYSKHNSTAYFVLSPVGNVATLMVADAGAIKQVGAQPLVFGKPLELYDVICVWGENLVASEGDKWRRHRKVVAPTFGEGNNRLVWDECLRICDEWFSIMDRDSTDGAFADPDVTCSTMRLALLVISSAAFGQSLPWIDEPLDEKSSNGHEMTFGASLEGLLKEFVLRILLPSWAYYLPIQRLNDCAAYYKEFEVYMREMIEARRLEIAEGTEFNDLFGILIKSSDQEEGASALSEREMLSNIYVMLLAGHETTGHTLAATLLFLALYPEHQNVLHKEAVEFLSGPSPSYSNFSSLKWSAACFYETLRLMPAILTIPKRALADTHLTIHTISPTGEPIPTQVFIPAGTNVRLDAHAVHHNPLYWDDSTTFRPSRFVDTETYKWNRDHFAAFSVGQRGCIGKTFAVVEATVVLSKILLHYEVCIPDAMKAKFEKRADESEDERVHRIYSASHAITLTPAKGLGVSFVRRGAA